MKIKTIILGCFVTALLLSCSSQEEAPVTVDTVEPAQWDIQEVDWRDLAKTVPSTIELPIINPQELDQGPWPDFNQYTNVVEKKDAFFRHLQPALDASNEEIMSQRHFLLALSDLIESGDAPGQVERLAYTELSEAYKLPGIALDQVGIKRLLERVDVLPEALVFSQAAHESGWGTSRFAVEGSNLFGQWCYQKGCGLVPMRRPAGSTHEVKVFKSAHGSLRGYLYNINSNEAYAPLRSLRSRQRAEQGEGDIDFDALELATGLEHYSERGHPYVLDIQQMIRVNQQFWRQG